ncbi:tyrosine-type recombinase/integrase [Methylobacterium nigriterrae]|uniref:tyrosine-type recombinase/integrase n=1 Tax=Methylobacterium nigriterrae TaxID=3127512 RepID=UPI00301323A9
MPKELLTDARVKAVAPPSNGILELWDTRCAGLCLRVMPTGLKSWTVRYTPQGGSSKRRERIGAYPTVSLSDARERANRIRMQVDDGADPSAEHAAAVQERRAEEERKALTFAELADFYVEKYAKREKASWQNDAGYLNRHVREPWGRRPASAITKQDAARLLFDVKERTPVGANRTRSVLAKLFSWAVDEGLLDTSPMVGVKKPAKEGKGKTRTLTDDELRIFWRALDTAPLSASVVSALRVLMLLGQRPGEIAGLQRSELVNLGRPKDARIEFPPERMKARRPHVVPLPSMALDLITASLKADDRAEGFVFVSRYADKQRLARHSLSQAMGRVIAGLEPEGNDAYTVRRLQSDPPTPHDLRRTVATRLAELRIPREDRLAVLAHTWGDVHEAHYDRYERLREKRIALDAWERHLRAVLSVEHSSASIVPFVGVHA